MELSKIVWSKKAPFKFAFERSAPLRLVLWNKPYSKFAPGTLMLDKSKPLKLNFALFKIEIELEARKLDFSLRFFSNSFESFSKWCFT